MASYNRFSVLQMVELVHQTRACQTDKYIVGVNAIEVTVWEKSEKFTKISSFRCVKIFMLWYLATL